MFVNDRINYSRYLSVYWCDMQMLPSTNPDAHTQMTCGEFAVQRSQMSSFSQVPVDQSLEQSNNRDTKSKDGLIGFTLSSRRRSS